MQRAYITHIAIQIRVYTTATKINTLIDTQVQKRTQPIFAIFVPDAFYNAVFMKPVRARTLDPIYSSSCLNVIKCLKANTALPVSVLSLQLF